MNLFRIAYKSLRQRALASSLTGLSVGLGVALMVTVLVLHATMTRMFSQSASGYDLIVGPKGSKLQLVLNTIYRVSQPIENLPYRYYQQLKQDPRIEAAVPFALGDVTQRGGFPIVGTTPEYFLIEYMPGRRFRGNGTNLSRPFDAIIGSLVARRNGWTKGDQISLVHGGVADHVHDEKFTIVSVLEPTGTPNDKTVFVHIEGFWRLAGHEKPLDEAIERYRQFFGEDPRPEELRVRSDHDAAGDHVSASAHAEHGPHETPTPHQRISAGTRHGQAGKPADEATSGDGNPHSDHSSTAAERQRSGHEADANHAAGQEAESHGDRAPEHPHEDHDEAADHAEHGAIPDIQKEVTAVLLRVRSMTLVPQIEAEINEGVQAQAVNPIREIRWLLENIVGNVRTLSVVLTSLIVIVSGVSILVSIYNSMSERRREIAIMRALGASRRTVFGIILAESMLLCFGGGVAGVVLGHGLVFAAAPIIEARSGYLVDPFAFDWVELALLPALLLLATLVGFLPGVTAYRTDVARALAE